jgi:hypothetical protein
VIPDASLGGLRDSPTVMAEMLPFQPCPQQQQQQQATATATTATATTTRSYRPC